MPTTNESLQDAALRHKIWILKHETQIYNEALVGFLNDMDKDLTDGLWRRLEKIKSRGVDSGVFTTKKMKDLQTWTRQMIADQTQEMHAHVNDRLTRAAEFEGEWQAKAIEKAAPVTLNTVTPAAPLLHQIVTQHPLEGSLLREWTSSWGTAKKRRVEQAIRLGLAEGQTADQIARTLKGTRAAKFKDGVLEISRRGARALIRTTTNAVTTAAREATYQENAEIVKGVRWLSTLDNRTTPICQSRDGKVYKLGQGPRPPAHIGCRSTTVPVLKSFRQLGLDIDEIPPGRRPFVRGQLAGDVPATETYGSWLKKQPANFQDEVLGKSKGQLFRNGDVSLDRFVDRNTGKAYTLDTIRRREPEVWADVIGDAE